MTDDVLIRVPAVRAKDIERLTAAVRAAAEVLQCEYAGVFRAPMGTCVVLRTARQEPRD